MVKLPYNFNPCHYFSYHLFSHHTVKQVLVSSDRSCLLRIDHMSNIYKIGPRLGRLTDAEVDQEESINDEFPGPNVI